MARIFAAGFETGEGVVFRTPEDGVEPPPDHDLYVEMTFFIKDAETATILGHVLRLTSKHIGVFVPHAPLIFQAIYLKLMEKGIAENIPLGTRQTLRATLDCPDYKHFVCLTADLTTDDN